METQGETIPKEQPRSCVTRSRDRKVSTTRPRRSHETEEEAALRRFHDAQRMARFRARKRKQQQEQQQVNNRHEQPGPERLERQEHPESPEAEGKYSQLLTIIEALGRDVRLTYAGSRSSAERLKSGIVRARSLVRECLVETRINRKQ